MTSIEIIRPGIVRNLLKETFFLRVPADRDRPGRVHPIEPTTDLSLDYQDWILVEEQLIRYDRRKILLIIQYPYFTTLPSQFIEFVDGPTPPSNTNLYWISSITGLTYVYDPTLGMWRSINPETVPFFRSSSSGTPLLPFGAQASPTSALWVNSFEDRDYYLQKLFIYVNDRTGQPNPHDLVLVTSGDANEDLTVTNQQTVEIVPAVRRILAPGEEIRVLHAPEAALVHYLQVVCELVHVVPPV